MFSFLVLKAMVVLINHVAVNLFYLKFINVLPSSDFQNVLCYLSWPNGRLSGILSYSLYRRVQVTCLSFIYLIACSMNQMNLFCFYVLKFSLSFLFGLNFHDSYGALCYLFCESILFWKRMSGHFFFFFAFSWLMRVNVIRCFIMAATEINMAWVALALYFLIRSN